MKLPLVSRALPHEGNSDIIVSLDPGRDSSTNSRGNSFADDTAATKVHRRIEQVHMAAEALRQTRYFAEDFRGHSPNVAALRHCHMMRPVSGREKIDRPKRTEEHTPELQ